MHYGFRIVEDMIDGLSQYMDAHGYRTIEDFRGRAVPNVKDWGDLDLNYKVIADINRELCIGCQLCYIACEDGAHQAIAPYETRRMARQSQRKIRKAWACTSRGSSRKNAWAAISARWFARLRIASP